MRKDAAKEKLRQEPTVKPDRVVKESDLTGNWWETLTEEELTTYDKQMGDEFFEEGSPYDITVGSLIRDYQLCEKFKVLPNAGGLHDQNPFFLDAMYIITSEIAEYESQMSKNPS